MKIHCKHCQRYLFTATGDVMIDEMPCPGCGAKNNFKIVLGGDILRLEHKAQEVPPKTRKEKNGTN